MPRPLTTPGIKPGEIRITVVDHVRMISGEHRESEEEEDRDYVRRGRRYASSSRSMTLSVGIDAEEVKARAHDGVAELTIPLPKPAIRTTVALTPTADRFAV